MIGKVTKLDLNTDNRARGQYDRMAIFVNLGWLLVPKIPINGNPQRIEYEKLPVVCFKCGCYGHTKETCSSNIRTSRETEKGESLGCVSTTAATTREKEYGP